MTRYFTLDEAQRLLPEVEGLLRRAVDGHSRAEQAEREWLDLKRSVVLLGGTMLDPVRTVALKSAREAAVREVNDVCQAIHDMGVQVKDLGIGLIDFPTLYRGKEVLLCFRLGETGISHWHGTDEGFRGRKPIDRDFLDNHRGSGVH